MRGDDSTGEVGARRVRAEEVEEAGEQAELGGFVVDWVEGGGRDFDEDLVGGETRLGGGGDGGVEG